MSVPIDVLVGEFAVAETNNRDQRHFDAAIGGRNSGQHPGHFLRVSEGEDHFINELIFANSAGDGSKRGVGWHHRYKLMRIEVAQGGLAVTARHDGDVVDVTSSVIVASVASVSRVTNSSAVCSSQSLLRSCRGMAGIILRFSPASIIASAWSARESEKQARVGGIIPDKKPGADCGLQATGKPVYLTSILTQE